jgi:amino acid transporter
MSIWSVSALGIGSMVGAGIFALLGQAALAVGSGTWMAFAIGGGVALLSGYAYARLAASFPGEGGIAEFFREGFPSRTLRVALGILYLVTLALTIAMVAKAFGAYAARLLHEPAIAQERVNVYAAAIILVLVLLNVIGSGSVGQAEVLLVAVKLAILVLLLVAGARTIDANMLARHGDVTAGAFASSVGLTFFAYAGYGMMANAAADVADPEVVMPRAFFLAIGVTILLYVTLALVVLGNVAPAELARYADTAVAQAAQPVLGTTGFVIVSVGALLATASAINATLFSALNIMRDMAAHGSLPTLFARTVWRRGTLGLFLSVAVVVAMTVMLDLGSPANVASATFLACYLAVYACAWRLRATIGASPALVAGGAGVMAVVFAAFLAGLWHTQPWGVLLIAAFAAGAWIVTLRLAPTRVP